MLIAPMKQDLGLYSGHNHVIETSSSLQCRNPIPSNIVKQLLQPPPSCGVFLNKSNQDQIMSNKQSMYILMRANGKSLALKLKFLVYRVNILQPMISLIQQFTRISRELEVLTRRQVLKVASLNMSGRQLLNASQALF